MSSFTSLRARNNVTLPLVFKWKSITCRHRLLRLPRSLKFPRGCPLKIFLKSHDSVSCLFGLSPRSELLNSETPLEVRFPAWRSSPEPWLPLFSATPQGWWGQGPGSPWGLPSGPAVLTKCPEHPPLFPRALIRLRGCSSGMLIHGFSSQNCLGSKCYHYNRSDLSNHALTMMLPKVHSWDQDGRAVEASASHSAQWAHLLWSWKEILLSQLWRLSSCSFNICQLELRHIPWNWR